MAEEKKVRLINVYRYMALIEAVSYIILLFVAMPLKYIWSIPEGVKYFGWIHGVLFLFYFVMLIAAAFKYRWGIFRIVYYLVASVVPILPFVIDKKLKKEATEA